jgi:serine-type D-Ala-D-Ala carboxypeptidase/endopeptidase
MLALAVSLPSTFMTRNALAQDDRATQLLRQRVAQEGVGLVAFEASAAGVRFAAAGARVLGGEPPDEQTRFEWGSISKTFTALLLADLVVRGELKLDDALEEVLPKPLRLRDSKGEPLRWRDVATHRSGLPRLPPNLRPADEADPYADYGADALEAFIAGWRPSLARDTTWEYSNLGYGLLGHALGLRLGLGFEAALRQRVLAPLGLGAVQLRMVGSRVAAAAQGHDAQRKPVPPWQFQVLAGAGALVGSITDMARYAQAAVGLLETPLAAAFRLALTRQAAGPEGVGMGLAWMLGTLVGQPLANHDGGTSGFSSSLMLDLAARRATGVIANAHVVVRDLALHLLHPGAPLRDVAAEQVATKAASERKPVALPESALKLLEGVYAANAQFKINLRSREGRLFAQATGQGEFELFALGEGRFFARVAPIEVEFEAARTADAPPAAFVLRQSGQRVRFVRE